MAVRWSAVMPVRRRLAPTGLRPSSKLSASVRRTSDQATWGSSHIPASRRSARRMPRHLGNSRWWPPSGVRSRTALGSRATSQVPTSGGEISSCDAVERAHRAGDGRQVEPALELALDVAGQARHAALHARLQPRGQRVDRPRCARQLGRARPRPPARARGCARSPRRAGRGRGTAPRPQPARPRSCRARSPRTRAGRRRGPPARRDRRRPRPAGGCRSARWPRACGPSAAVAAAPRAASPPPDQPSSRARSTCAASRSRARSSPSDTRVAAGIDVAVTEARPVHRQQPHTGGRRPGVVGSARGGSRGCRGGRRRERRRGRPHRHRRAPARLAAPPCARRASELDDEAQRVRGSGYPAPSLATSIIEGEPGAELPVGQGPQRGAGGPRRCGQDHAGGGAPPPHRHDQPAGARGGRIHRERPRPRGAAPRHLAVAVGGALRVEGPQGQPDRHARATPTSSATSAPPSASSTSRCSW